MKTNPFFVLLFATFVATSACSTTVSPPAEEAPVERNMFGHRVTRGVTVSADSMTPGYVLFAVPNSSLFYLIDREGRVVHQWKGNYRVMGAYLQDDGSLVQNVSDPDFPVFAGGGETGRIQKISWEGKILWDFEYANETEHAHHDFAVMPNGNVLALAWESRSKEDALRAGRDPARLPEAGLWPDKVVEIEPQGKYGGSVVWEWHLWDHLIQDRDPTKDNYGDPAAHPELLDINFNDPEWEDPISRDSLDKLHAQKQAWRNQTMENWGSDLLHSNAINYNPDLDQIAISVRQLSEILIIDHSTTTKEAAGHAGGGRGKGGDILFRWGNPQNYRQGDSTDQQLFHQHDVRWIEPGSPGAGNLTIFNNDIPGRPDSMNYSAVFEIRPPSDGKGNYKLGPDGKYGPDEPRWSYQAPDTVSFWGSFISGAHRMPNGNTLITEGPKGRFFEVTPEGRVVWEYLNPFRGNIHHMDGDPVSPMPMTYSCFRATFIPADHPGLAGRTLTPLDPQPDPFLLPPPEEIQ